MCFSGNIFIHRNPKFLQSPESGLESCEDEEDEVEEAVLYKIGKSCKLGNFRDNFIFPNSVKTYLPS